MIKIKYYQIRQFKWKSIIQAKKIIKISILINILLNK